MNTVITQVTSKDITTMVETSINELNYIELKIESYDELFHALVHVNPRLLIVEIDGINNTYMKIIRIMKKTRLTQEVPVLAILKDNSHALVDAVAELNINAIIYPPYSQVLLNMYIARIVQAMDCKERMLLNQDLKTVQSVMISGLASLAEYRDPETGEHIKRTQNYVKALATTLRKKGLFLDELTQENIKAMYMSVPLHDIGKVGIKDDILLKPGRLTKEEFEVMKEHTRLGYESLRHVGNQLKKNIFIEYATDVAYTHHEKYDGSGYPRGLKGTEIPLIGRLMAVADVYDALTSKRVYKDAMSHYEAMEIIKEGSGSHFDPIILDCAVELEATFHNIAQTYKDNETSTENHMRLRDLYSDKLLKKILVVEDSRIVREITKNQLEAIGFTVEVAVNGEEGYHKILENEYDLVLLDIEMPKMNGYEMAEKLKPFDNKAVMIAMTAADYNTTIHELKAYGISGLILKPLDFNRLATLYAEIKDLYHYHQS